MTERFTYEQVAKDSIRVFDNGKKMHPIGDVVHTLNKQDLRINNLKNKMDYQAFELYKYGVISFEKAVELSDMNFQDFLKYCKDNGHPMELQL